MAKRTFLKKACTSIIAIMLCIASAFGMVACNPQSASLTAGDNLNSNLVVWTHDGNVEKILQKRLASDPTSPYVDYSDYHSSKEFVIGVFKNEIEASNIILTAGDKKVESYDITIPDLTCGDYTLPGTAFTVYNQKYIENIPKEGVFGGGWYPDCLLPFKTAKEFGENYVDPHNNQALYITVKPAIDQPAGVYTGDIEIKADGKTIIVPATVEVYDFVLPTEPIGDYAAGYSIDNLQAGELDSTQEMMETYYEFFLDFRCSPGHLPGFPGSAPGSKDTHDAYYKKWVELGRKYTRDDRVGFINLPYSGTPVDIKFKTEFIDETTGKIVYETNEKGEQILDENGKPIPVMTTKTEQHNVADAGQWILQLRKLVEGSFLDENGDGTFDPETEFVNLFSKASTYFVYFDEFSSTYGKDKTAIVTLQFVVFAAHLVSDEYRQKWTTDDTPELTDQEKEVLDSIISIKHRAISTSTAPLENSDYVVSATFTCKDNESLKETSKWTQNYKYYGQYDEDNGEEDTFEDKDPIFTYNGANRCTLNMEKWTESVFVTGITHYATEESRQEYLNYAEKCQFYNHEKWVYTAENPKYPNVNNHLDTSLWGIRAMGWMQADYDANGNLYWSSTLCRQFVTINPQYVDYLQDYYQTAERYRGTNGDGYVAYIGRPYDIDGPLAGTRLHAIRDGNEDYDLLYYLEQFYVERAKELGLEYSDKGFKNVLHTMTESLYDGVKTITSTTDKMIYDARKLVAKLLVMAQDTGAILENYEIVENNLVLTVSAPEGVEIKIDNSVKTGVTNNGITSYVIKIPMLSSAQTFKLSAVKDGVSYDATFDVKSLVKEDFAGNHFTNAFVVPTTVNSKPVNAGTVSKVTVDDGGDVSAVKATFIDYYSYDVSGTHVKVANTGNIDDDFVEIDTSNRVVTVQRYTYVVRDNKYTTSPRGKYIKGVDNNYYLFSNTDSDIADVYFGRLNRYIATDDISDTGVLDNQNGTHIKCLVDGVEKYVRFDPTAMDKTSVKLLLYSVSPEGDFIEDSNGSYILKKDGNVENVNDYVKILDGEERNRYSYGAERQQLELDISKLNITTNYSLLGIKIYVEKDMNITLGGKVGSKVEYAAEVFKLKAGWNEIHIKPALLGAGKTTAVKAIRFRLAGVEKDATLTVGKIFIIK